jgi:MATE family multidrug resistance protein
MTASSTLPSDPTVRPSHHPTLDDVRRLLRLAGPIVTIQVGLMLMGVVDTILVGHVSPGDLAAAAVGNLYFFAFVAFGMGTLFALDPVVAQAVGAGDTESVARAIQRGLVLALGLSLVLSLAFLPAAWVLSLLGQPPEIVPRAAAFARVSIPGLFPFLAFIVLRQSLLAMHRTGPVVLAIVLANVVNAFLCWVFVFGKFGCPKLGVVGAGWAATSARWFLAAALLTIAWRDLATFVRPRRRGVFTLAPILRMLRLGAPIGVQNQLEFGVFALIALLMGRLGTIPVAAHQIAINIASLTFMVPLGVSGAAAVLVGHAVGAQDPDRARRAAVVALACGVAFMIASATAFLLFPVPLARVYSSDAAVVALAASLIPIAGVFQVFDGLQVVAIGVLRGIGDTRAPMIVNVLGFWLIGFPVSLWLGYARGGGPQGLWWGLVVGLAAVAGFLILRVWIRMRGTLARLQIDEPTSPRLA